MSSFALAIAICSSRSLASFGSSRGFGYLLCQVIIEAQLRHRLLWLASERTE
jgi:hypothetical protein